MSTLSDDVCRALHVVDKAIEERRGVKPRYRRGHVLQLMELLYSKAPLGRLAIARAIGLSEASTKTLIKRLRSLGVVSTDPVAGSELTPYGASVISALLKLVPIRKAIEGKTEIIPWNYSIAFALSRGEDIVKRIGIIALRDLAVRLGADGLLILFRSGDEFYLPPTPPQHYSLPKPTVAQAIGREIVDYVKEGDAILVLGADSNGEKLEVCFWELVIEILRALCSTS